mmetsp:Transcript_51859/g.168562  ORF Transcript_51859/g.168562 Transcript_51859/m.168562 type:complete len:137 (+) Transcript_51859:315-725(+)
MQYSSLINVAQAQTGRVPPAICTSYHVSWVRPVWCERQIVSVAKLLDPCLLVPGSHHSPEVRIWRNPLCFQNHLQKRLRILPKTTFCRQQLHLRSLATAVTANAGIGRPSLLVHLWLKRHFARRNVGELQTFPLHT